MTNLEALRNDIIYPLDDGRLEKSLIDRGVEPSEAYSLLNKVSIEMARADMYVKIVAAPNIQEGGISISLTEKAIIKSMATAIYLKYGESDPFAVSGSVAGAKPW